MVKKFNFRSSFDLTPWNSEGHSAFGLRRNQAKVLALIFIVAGFILITPVGTTPTPDDLINFYIADKISSGLGFSYNTALIFTYTFIPISLIILGAWIYPHNTRSLLNGYINKAKKFIKKRFSSPGQIAISLFIFWMIYNLYKIYLFKGGI